MKGLNEATFTKLLVELKETAAVQGNLLTTEQVEEQFAQYHLNDEQMALVYEYLKGAKIGVDEPVDYDAMIEGEDRKYLDMYLEELAQLPTVSEGKKEALLLSVMSGDTSARNELTEAFLPQVVDIAKIYAGQGVLLEDLIGEGNVAVAVLMDMLGSQSTAKEAEEMIVQMVMQAMESLVYENQEESEGAGEWAEKANMLLEKANELADELLRKVTPEEVSKETGISVEEIEEILQATGGKIEVIDWKK
ncbi:MAG: hypothetical protein IJ336_09560 [Lachnospiraceae bacterium]|nr:hypothetical protein [Lachnospiraceae bacterium]